MSSLKNSNDISTKQPMQRPLPGFRMALESDKPGWTKFVETTLKGYTRVGYTKIKK